MKKISLALSGGGARCLFQLGFIEYLLQNNIEIDEISTVSGSSIIGTLLAQNRTPNEILTLLQKVDFKKIVSLNLLKGSLFKFSKAKELLEEVLQIDNFEDLDKKLYITVVNFDTSTIEYRENGNLADTILASCSLYPIFDIYTMENSRYIDGGFMNNLPIEPLSDKNTILSINVNPNYTISNKKIKFLSKIKRVLFLLFYANIEIRKKRGDFYFEHSEIGKYSILNRKDFEKFFKMGYNFAKNEDLTQNFIHNVKETI